MCSISQFRWFVPKISHILAVLLGAVLIVACNRSEPAVEQSGSLRPLGADFDENTSVLEVVEQYRRISEQEGTPVSFLDYYIVRESAIQLLVRSVQNPETENSVRTTALRELRVLDPENRLLIVSGTQETVLNSRQRSIVSLSGIAEVSAFNLALYDTAQQDAYLTSSNLESGFWNGEIFDRLFSASLRDTSSCTSTSSSLECVVEFVRSQGVPVILHPSVQAIFQQESDISSPPPRGRSTLAVMNDIADEAVSFLFIPNGLYVFIGNSIPEGWQTAQVSGIYNIQSKYLNVEALVNAIGAAGYSSTVRSIDKPSNSILISATPRQFVYIWLATNRLDVQTPRLRIDVEFLEIQDSFLRDVGFRIPQTIGAAFGDPIYRVYDFGDDITIPNDGLVTQIGSTGGVTLANYLSGNIQNIVRLLVADESFRVSAKEANISLDISERPSILIDSGSVGTLGVTQRIPVTSRQVTPTGSVNENVLTVETGVNLTVSAKVLDPRTISMGIDMSVSGFTPQAPDARTTALPAVSSRTISSSFTVGHRESIILGGIVSERNEQSSDGLPGFSLVPFLEVLGGNRTNRTSETRVIILLTPSIDGTQQPEGYQYLTAFGGDENIAFPPAVNGIINSYNIQTATQAGNTVGTGAATPNRGRSR